MGIFSNKVISKGSLPIFIKFLFSTVFAFVFSIMFQKAWLKHINLYHTILELTCVFIAVTIFISVWYTCQQQRGSYFFLGFGYLAVAFFDILHTYFHLKLDLNPGSYQDLSTRFWIIGRLFEGLTLFITINTYRAIKNKWIALFFTLGTCAAVLSITLYYQDRLPVLLTSEGLTPFKIALEYVVIFLYIACLLTLKNKTGQSSDNLTYQYIFLAILTSIPAELMFTAYSSIASITWTLGHILKIISYFYLLHGIFISSIIYPYKKLEQEHRLLEEKNEELVRDQEKMLHQEKLALLGQMGAGIVHETRNYLTTIKGCSQLIFHLTKEESTKRHSKIIDQNINEVNKIISEFLFLSKPREIQLSKVSLTHVFTSIKSIVETGSMLKNIPVEFKLSCNDYDLLCDEAQLKQVILNLSKNAAEAMSGSADPKLIIETGISEKQDEIFIRISDNGKGISEENLKKIGTPFFTTKKSGTGLGLNVCYKIIENHNGRISVQSKLNKGTTFTIHLPLMEADECHECQMIIQDAN